MKKICKNCRFHEPEYETKGVGACRIYPPTVHAIAEFSTTSYPQTYPTDWCGEWQPKEKRASEK